MIEKEYLQRRTDLTAHVTSFCRFLRQNGYSIGPTDIAQALEAISLIPLSRPELFKYSLQAVLVHSLGDLRRFEQLYTKYWGELSKAEDSKIRSEESEDGDRKGEENQSNRPPSIQVLKNWLFNGRIEEEIETATYSPGEGGGIRDLSTFSQEDLTEIIQILKLLEKNLANRKTRRYIHAKRGASFDLKNTVRKNMRRGGEIFNFQFRKRKEQSINLILLCDVSKSMDLYSRFLIQFLYGFQHLNKRIETFVFSTQLYRVTKALRNHEFSAALEELSDLVDQWSGGTAIGQSLNTFLNDYATKLLNRNSIVLILSDGWDTGDIDLLEASMRQIQRKAAKVIWLNPLAGNLNFEPTVKGMQAAWPYIDLFAPASNTASLREVVKKLKRK